jgi:hypothetical protein
MQASAYFLLKQVVNQTLTHHSRRKYLPETLAPHHMPMDSNNLRSLMMTNQQSIDHLTQFEDEERSRFARSRRAMESHDIELQAQIAERTIAI